MARIYDARCGEYFDNGGEAPPSNEVLAALREAAQAKGSPLSDAERNEVYMRFDNEILF